MLIDTGDCGMLALVRMSAKHQHMPSYLYTLERREHYKTTVDSDIVN